MKEIMTMLLIIIFKNQNSNKIDRLLEKVRIIFQSKLIKYNSETTYNKMFINQIQKSNLRTLVEIKIIKDQRLNSKQRNLTILKMFNIKIMMLYSMKLFKRNQKKVQLPNNMTY